MARKGSKRGKFLTIRKRILVIAIFATLVPSLLLGWITYYQTYELLRVKAVQELEGGLSVPAGEWIPGFRRNSTACGYFPARSCWWKI